MSENRAWMPLSVRRQVRQRCHFGCIFCGCPICQVHHVTPHRDQPEHNVDHLALLCGTCHDEVERGFFSEERVREHLARPFNSQRQTTPRELLLHGSGGGVGVELGGFHYRWMASQGYFPPQVPLMIDGVPIVKFRHEDGQILLSLVFYNDLGGVDFAVDDNEVVISTAHWDVEWNANRLTIRRAPREISFQLAFRHGALAIERGLFRCNGIICDIRSELVVFAPGSITLIENVMASFCNVGVAVGEVCADRPCGVAIHIPVDASHRTMQMRQAYSSSPCWVAGFVLGPNSSMSTFAVSGCFLQDPLMGPFDPPMIGIPMA